MKKVGIKKIEPIGIDLAYNVYLENSEEYCVGKSGIRFFCERCNVDYNEFMNKLNEQ